MDLNIEELVTKQVSLEVSELDIQGMVREVVAKHVEHHTGGVIRNLVTEAAKERVYELLEQSLESEVRTDNGWGQKETYKTFEDMVRQVFKKALDDKYEVKRVLEQLVSQRVTALLSGERNAVVEKVVDELTHSKLVKPPKACPTFS